MPPPARSPRRRGERPHATAEGTIATWCIIDVAKTTENAEVKNTPYLMGWKAHLTSAFFCWRGVSTCILWCIIDVAKATENAEVENTLYVVA